MNGFFSKILFSLTAITASVIAAPQTVIFDWGNVIAFEDRKTVVDFLCETFALSEKEFELVNIIKRQAIEKGKTDVQFWQELALERKIALPIDWVQNYHRILKTSVGANPEMYALIDALKEKKMRVGLLSNIDDRYVKLIRNFGFYDAFDPCLLSCEMGWEKPDPKAYQLLLDTLQLPASSIVFIDDKAENVEASKRLGIDAIQFQSVEQLHFALKEREVL